MRSSNVKRKRELRRKAAVLQKGQQVYLGDSKEEKLIDILITTIDKELQVFTLDDLIQAIGKNQATALFDPEFTRGVAKQLVEGLVNRNMLIEENGTYTKKEIK